MPPRAAIILVAGEGTRLRAAHDCLPKGFVEVGGETLVGRSLRLLRSRGFERVVLVAGYRAACFMPLAQLHPWVQVVTNESYAAGGSLDSLAVGLRELGAEADFFVLEGDLYYEPRALDLLLSMPAGNVGLATDATGAGDEVWVDAPGGRLRGLSKDRSALPRVDGEMVGLWRLRTDAGAALAALAGYVPSGSRGYDTEGLAAISGEVEIRMHRESGLLWGEIDNPAHLTRARESLAPRVLAAETRVTVPRRILLNPGPATTSDAVKHALVVPDVCPREEEFLRVLERLRHGLACVAGDPRDVVAIPFAASGTGALEAVIGSIVPEKGALLVLDNGDYGARLAEIATRLHVPVERIRFGWGEPLSVELLETVLVGATRPFTHLAVVHHETSTGMLNPLEPLAAVCRHHSLSLIVDAMSSFGAVPVDGIGWDYLVSSTNKCLQGMAGLSFVIARRQAVERARESWRRGFYFDLVAQHDVLRDTRQTRYTAPPQLVYAADRALADLERETVAGRRRRYAACFAQLLSGIRSLGLEPLLANDAWQSRILLAVRAPRAPWYSFEALAEAMLDAGITIYPGKSPVMETFRLSVIGDLYEDDMRYVLDALGDYLTAARNGATLEREVARC